MTPKAIIIHSLDQGRLAAGHAAALEVPVLLASAPAGAAYLGPLWLEEVLQRLQSEFPRATLSALLDCGDAPGPVLAALRAGVKVVRFTGKRALTRKLQSIAEQQGARIVTGRLRALDLALESDPDQACRAWLTVKASPRKAAAS